MFNITDDEGPVSATVTVFYDVPVNNPASPSPPLTGGVPQKTVPSALMLSTDFIYKGFYTGQQIDWPITLSGGQAPYAISVDWGDGTSDVMSVAKAGSIDLSHIYSKAGGAQGAYVIKIKAADSYGQNAYIQIFVIVHDKNPTIAVTANIYNKPTPTAPGKNNWLLVAWPAYVAILLLFISFWLGEREELFELKKRGLLKRRA